jgi:hypothetical protein
MMISKSIGVSKFKILATSVKSKSSQTRLKSASSFIGNPNPTVQGAGARVRIA